MLLFDSLVVGFASGLIIYGCTSRPLFAVIGGFICCCIAYFMTGKGD